VVPSGGDGTSVVASSAGSTSVDPLLIQQTKNEIRSLVQEITLLSRASISAESFYEEFLRRVVAALAAEGGAIWIADSEGDLEIAYQIRVPEEMSDETSGPAGRHALLVKNVLASGQATLVPPQSGGPSDEEAGNPSDFLLVLVTLRVEQEAIGVIEVLQRAGGGPTTQRGYLRFLVQMSELAGEFLRNRRLRHLGDRQQLWNNLEHFIHQVHRSLDAKATAFTLANEGRRLIRCDRASVTLARQRRQIVEAVSGLDTIDRRGDEAKLLERLASAVAATRQPLWHWGQSQNLPPQIEKHLDAYLDRSHATALGILPLFASEDESSGQRGITANERAFGTLIVEQLQGTSSHEGFAERAEVVAGHGASALANAREHESLFLLPVWRALGKARGVVQARTLPKTLLVCLILLAVVLGLVFIPADFELAARGKLQPSVRSDVFAHLDGVVVNVPVRHEQVVRKGDVLAQMTNSGLAVEIENLEGRRRTTQERIQSIRRAQLDGYRSSTEDRNRLGGELLELSQVAENIERELSLLLQKQEHLTVRSDMDGQVVTWNVDAQLSRRPVQTGQLLMTVVDLGGDWELELYMPERRMGHVAAAAVRFPEGLHVVFTLASHPGREFEGQVIEVQRKAEVQGDEGNAVIIRVAIDREKLPELRSETSVTARVFCGRRSLGYVLFHDVLETIQTKLLFWI
jgi:multidrug resistance efflux pump